MKKVLILLAIISAPQAEAHFDYCMLNFQEALALTRNHTRDKKIFRSHLFNTTINIGSAWELSYLNSEFATQQLEDSGTRVLFYGRGDQDAPHASWEKPQTDEENRSLFRMFEQLPALREVETGKKQNTPLGYFFLPKEGIGWAPDIYFRPNYSRPLMMVRRTHEIVPTLVKLHLHQLLSLHKSGDHKNSTFDHTVRLELQARRAWLDFKTAKLEASDSAFLKWADIQIELLATDLNEKWDNLSQAILVSEIIFHNPSLISSHAYYQEQVYDLSQKIAEAKVLYAKYDPARYMNAARLKQIAHSSSPRLLKDKLRYLVGLRKNIQQRIKAFDRFLVRHPEIQELLSTVK